MHRKLAERLNHIRARYAQFKGKMRRFYLCAFKKRYVADCEHRRHGECSRCGQCCKLVFECPFLKTEGDQTTCVIYGFRLAQCRRFPIDERDLSEVSTQCGYRF